MDNEIKYYEELKDISIKGARDFLPRYSYMQNRTFNKKGLFSIFKKTDYSSLIGHGEMLRDELSQVQEKLEKIMFKGTEIDEQVAIVFISFFTNLKAALTILIQINERQYLKAKKQKEFSDKDYNDMVNYYLRFDELRDNTQKAMSDVIRNMFAA
ncbi:hypothetical protein V7182_18895 [Neobacillus drentensis]|uniref:hypothetical protein n=1 Tax=Neobacillus drentensis TaxID=220684 RepID=UPI002FFE4F43